MKRGGLLFLRPSHPLDRPVPLPKKLCAAADPTPRLTVWRISQLVDTCAFQ